MAVSLRVSPVPQEPQKPEAGLPAALVRPTHAYLARLAALHDEAAATAHLANLLGRSPWIAAIIGAAALSTGLAGGVGTAGLAVWLGLTAIAVTAILRAYAKAIDAPFDRTNLKGFAATLSAALLFAGFAWGAGFLLALPEGTGLAGSLLFALGPAAVLAAVLRARDVAFCFLVPAAAMSAFAALMQGFDLSAALAILAGGILVAAANYGLERLSPHRLDPQLG